MGVILDDLAKHGGATNATKNQQEMNKATTDYLTTNTSGPMVKAMPRGGFGERAAAPSVENADETELVVDSSIFDTKVRELVQAAGAEYSIKTALANGTAVKVDRDVAEAMERLQNHAPLLNVAVLKAQQGRGSAGSQSGSASGTSVTGGTSSDDEDEAEVKKRMVKQVIDELLRRGHIFKAHKHPSRMNKAELSALLDTIPPGTPAYLSVNRQLAKVWQ